MQSGPENAISRLIFYYLTYIAISSSVLHASARTYKEPGHEHSTSPDSPWRMHYLGSFDDKNFLSGELTLVKSQLTHDLTYKLVVGSQITTGSMWFPADVYAGKEYKFTNHNYGDLKIMLTTDYKRHLAKNGILKHGFRVDPFKTLEDVLKLEPVMVGAPENMYTFLTVSKDVAPGDYVLLFAYGRTFSDDLPFKFKEFRVKVV